MINQVQSYTVKDVVAVMLETRSGDNIKYGTEQKVNYFGLFIIGIKRYCIDRECSFLGSSTLVPLTGLSK